MVERETIEAADVAIMTGLSAWTVYKLVREHKIPHIRVASKRVLFRRSSIIAWLEAQEQASVAVEPERAPGGVRRLEA